MNGNENELYSLGEVRIIRIGEMRGSGMILICGENDWFVVVTIVLVGNWLELVRVTMMSHTNGTMGVNECNSIGKQIGMAIACILAS